MAKFRANHNREKNPFVGLTLRVILMIAVIGALLWYGLSNYKVITQRVGSNQDFTDSVFEDYDRSHLLPEVKDVELVHHKYYSLGYDERKEQARWVCYVLNKSELQVPNVERTDYFFEDEAVQTGSATYYDYKGSGYSRGHLAPAGDMAFNREAMKESFYMSNMSPQEIPFNAGVWQDLENQVRQWAYANNRLYVVTGPIFESSKGTIGRNKVAVPSHFYKALMDIEGAEKKGVAFLIPHDANIQDFGPYAITIDDLEERLGFDLYPNLVDDQLEAQIEAHYDRRQWPIRSN